MSGQQNRRSIDGRTVFAAALSVLALVFVFENRRRVTIRFIAPEVHAQLWIALLAALVAGFIAGWLFGRRRS